MTSPAPMPTWQSVSSQPEAAPDSVLGAWPLVSFLAFDGLADASEENLVLPFPLPSVQLFLCGEYGGDIFILRMKKGREADNGVQASGQPGGKPHCFC